MATVFLESDRLNLFIFEKTSAKYFKFEMSEFVCLSLFEVKMASSVHNSNNFTNPVSQEYYCTSIHDRGALVVLSIFSYRILKMYILKGQDLITLATYTSSPRTF